MVLTPLNDASQLRAEEFVKRWCEYRLELMVVVFVHHHLDAFEENLVELAANMLGRSPVSTGTLFGQVDRHLNESSGIAEVCREVFELAVHPGELGIEALLFSTEHFDGDRVVVVRLEKLALSALNLKLLRGKGLRLNRCVVLEELQLLGQRASQGLGVPRLQRQPVVHFLNEVFCVVEVD